MASYLPMARHSMGRFLLMVLGPALVPFGMLAQAPGTNAPESQSTIRSGDMLRVQVFQKPELSGEFLVGPDGRIQHPVYRDIYVSGSTVLVVDSLVGDRIRSVEGNSPFVVQILHRISVNGSVRTPGFHFVPGDATLLNVLTHAGGITDEGDQTQVRVIRDGQRTQYDITRADPAVTRFTMQSGDEVLVPIRRSVFRTYIAPSASVIAMLVSIANLILRAQ